MKFDGGPTLPLLLVGLCALLSGHGVAPCSPTGLPDATLEEQVEAADAVVYGKALRLMDTPRYGAAYTVEMLVYCTLKTPENRELGAVINITEAGTIHGLCFATKFEAGQEYVAMVSWYDDKLRPWQGVNAVIHADTDTDQVQRVLRTCHLHPHVPPIPQKFTSGMAPPRKECFRPAPSEECPVHDHDHDHGDSHDHGEGHYHGDGHADHDQGDHDHGDGHYHGDGHDDHDQGDHDHGDGHYHGDGHDDHDQGDHDHGDGHSHGDGHDDHDHGEHDHGEGHYHGDGHDDHDHGDARVGQSSGSGTLPKLLYYSTFIYIALRAVVC